MQTYSSPRPLPHWAPRLQATGHLLLYHHPGQRLGQASSLKHPTGFSSKDTDVRADTNKQHTHITLERNSQHRLLLHSELLIHFSLLPSQTGGKPLTRKTDTKIDPKKQKGIKAVTPWGQKSDKARQCSPPLQTLQLTL